MQDVLEVYVHPYDPKHPVVCVDEASKELHATPHGTLPAQTAQPARQDYQHERQGTVNIFLAVEPLAGRRVAQVTNRRIALDFSGIALKFYPT